MIYPKDPLGEIRKAIWIFIGAMLLIGLSLNGLYGQQLSGGSGICVVTGNPNLIPDIVTVDVTTDCTTAYDEFTGDRWKYYPTRPLGNRWLMESNGIDTNIDNIEVDGGFLKIQESSSEITIDVKQIAPIQTVAVDPSSPNMTFTETIGGSGDWILNLTETPIQVVQAGNLVTITNEEGTEFSFTAGETDVSITGGGDVIVTESTPNDFIISFTETHINVDDSTPNQISITNEDGVTKTFITADDVKDIQGAGDIQVNEIGTTGTYVVSFVESVIQVIQNGDDITIIDEDGVPHTFTIVGGGGGLNIHGIYNNDPDAASNGCPIGGIYETSLTNTLGEPVGTIRKRIN